MADELKNKLYMVTAIVGLVIAAAGGWTAVVMGRSDITFNKETNDIQQVSIITNIEGINRLKSRIDIHQAESAAIQKNIEILQSQVAEDIEKGNERFIEILERLPKRQ